MDEDRRKFLKLAGVAALGIGSASLVKTVNGKERRSGKFPQALEGKRWAMVIDLAKCQEHEGCTLCMNACNQVHNIPHFDDPRHEIKWIWKEPFENALPNQEEDFLEQGVSKGPAVVLCNHCERPPCVRVCPTQATFKREDGIVMMDMHRCIGCRYCIVACPYGSRSFNWQDPHLGLGDINPGYPTRMRGVVEKCIFCEERLAKGKLPACVEACPYGALTFGDLDDPGSKVRKLLKSRYAVRRKVELGTRPGVFYLV
ncbi:MAG: 4Fe-4S dicluster domain-containing protein [Deltaproteobacteria bacterium]|nr:4Fe-4S dicluster domain-containing protein [Deltaproteobacteria bacterium]